MPKTLIKISEHLHSVDSFSLAFVLDERNIGRGSKSSFCHNCSDHLCHRVGFWWCHCSSVQHVGNVRVDFDVQNERSDEKVVGGSVEGEIGTSPQVRVELRTNTGDIAIRKAP